jgi:dTDP-glucose pyrophosphorylase
LDYAGEKITFVRQEKPSGISDALVLCEQEALGGDDDQLLN